jgi:hypothetical protein
MSSNNYEVVDHTIAGDMSFDWDFAGPDGAAFVLKREARHTDEDVENAKRELYRDRDVVGAIRVVRINHA